MPFIVRSRQAWRLAHYTLRGTLREELSWVPEGRKLGVSSETSRAESCFQVLISPPGVLWVVPSPWQRPCLLLASAAETEP